MSLPLKPVNLLLSVIRSFSEQVEKEDEVYYYHGDHLGSASWITDKTGTPVQYIHYAPYGEFIANQRASGYDERFKFTGKERDAESGYNYHGARFLWGDAGFWLSVDPLVDKYIHQSPYLYCNGNPIMLVDPDGRGTFYCDGEELGNDGIDNGKKYIMKTSMPKFSENELFVDGAAYDQIALDNAKSYIKEHSSQSDAFTEKADIYDCFVEVVASNETRQAMYNWVMQDHSGKEGADRREYGGYIIDGKSQYEKMGEVVVDPSIPSTYASISFAGNYSTYHSHPSYNKNGNFFYQLPSSLDFSTARGQIQYVFAMRTGIVYIHNDNVILATYPMSCWVNLTR